MNERVLERFRQAGIARVMQDSVAKFKLAVTADPKQDLIKSAHKANRKVGICGQAPSDYSDFATFLVQAGIDSISLNPDSIIEVKQRIGRSKKNKGK